MDLRAGLSTETGYLNTPDGATTDEANFRILIDGSRRRRRGLRLESGGSAYTLPLVLGASGATARGEWNNAGGDADKDFVVVQIGTYLHIYENTGDTLSTEKLSHTVPLETFSTTGVTADTANNPVSMASGNGRLLVVGRYLEPFVVEYDPATDTFTHVRITILERDFHTIKEGGVRASTQPTTLSEAHEYNLRNRGWKDEDITQYFTDKAKYPALGMLWYKGYARLVDGTTYINEDGVKDWNSDKMEAEPFGNASAPLGSLIINPFDTTEAYLSASETISIVGNWSVASLAADPWVVTINTSVAHGLTHPATITITGNSFFYEAVDPDPSAPAGGIVNQYWSFDGTYTTASVVDGDTITVNLPRPWGFDSFEDQYRSPGVLQTGGVLENTVDGYTTNERPTVCGWYAGRAWFMGVNHPELIDKLYFSRLLYQNDKEFGHCLQRNDPASEDFNQLNDDDGGTIVISDIGRPKGVLVYNGLLLVFSDEGVWEISGNRNVFTASNYNVRKITDSGASSEGGFASCEGVVMFTGPMGITQIQPDERSGILFAQNLSAPKVQTIWNNIPAVKQTRAKVRYDSANKQVWFLYSTDSTDTYAYQYNEALVYDLRLQAFSRMTFPYSAASYIIEALPIKEASVDGVFKKLKFFVQVNTGTTLNVCDFDHANYVDFDSTEQTAYLQLAYDNIGSWTHRRQAPKVHTFMGKTETGFDPLTLAPVNESSLKMQARWDWSDHANAGEWGTETEVYRHVRAYVPSGTGDPFNSGYPVVVTRNKVRGRGRSLHLRFTGATAKDAHLLGYGVHYIIGGKV